VWAPRNISVIGAGTAGEQVPPLRRLFGIWEGVVGGLGHGARYKYAIVGPDDVTREKADPFAARAEHPPATASIVWQPRHEWRDREWMATRHLRQSRAAPISIYEVHLGSWRRDHRVLGYRELGEQLGAQGAGLHASS
jgi:1,4-alpha-glucan branching enzyme